MSTDAKLEPRAMAGRLFLTIAGMLLMFVPPFAFELTRLSSQFQNGIIAGIELSALVVGLVLLYLGVREPKPARSKS
jgi:hypothetical protein